MLYWLRVICPSLFFFNSFLNQCFYPGDAWSLTGNFIEGLYMLCLSASSLDY